uniref:RNA-directed DNA polymerase, eukaryota, reverse transcriptase zinc-binding domain protein n=1 Tax=Tanacetum cinerariifolium TaxID=118510 RepID=A0A6L2L366_TANCI|nr:hypothetical protein [Tanacetum cinerariifolium]
MAAPVANTFDVLNMVEDDVCGPSDKRTMEDDKVQEEDSLWSRFQREKKVSNSKCNDLEDESDEDEVYEPNDDYTAPGYASLMRDKPWVLLDDFNVALNLEDHSCGGYQPDIAMREFKECVQRMQVMDVTATEGASTPLDDQGLFTRVFANHKAEFMVRDVLDREIKDALFSMRDDKAPGPDGFTTTFFKKLGDIIGGEITIAIREIFSNNDLFLFARGHPNSVWVIIDALEEFKNVLGLVPSIPKSTAFFCNVLNALKASILSYMPFPEGTLPVKYIGVPFISSKLLYRDCKLLVEKLAGRVNDWRNKFLSLAGRLQFVISILSSMHIYWDLVFILPVHIIHELEQLMRGFLWCQGEMKKGKAKVAWEAVCLPHREGGLRIRILDDFNVAIMATHVWCILINKESLWVQWIHSYKLKGRSLWDVPCLGDRWPHDWSSRFLNIVNILVPNINHELDDVIVGVMFKGFSNISQLVHAFTGMSSVPPQLMDVLAFLIPSKGSSVSNVIFSDCSYCHDILLME